MRFALPPVRSRHARAALRRSAIAFCLTTTVLAVGCGGYNSMFPRREEIFKPIPVELGEVRVQGADTSYVLVGTGYQIVARDRELLPEAKSALDRVAGTWRQYFSAEPTPMTVVLRPPARRGSQPDSVVPTPNPGTTGVVFVAARRPREDDERDMRRPPDLGMRDGASTLPVVRAWLSALAGGYSGLPAAVPGAVDTTAAAGSPRSPFARVDDPRVADWIESALPSLVVTAPDAEIVALQLVQHPERILPLRTLLTSARPTSGADSARDRQMDPARVAQRSVGRGGPPSAGRGVPALSGARLFDAEAVSFASFLAEREGRAFLGRTVRVLLAGGALEEALKDVTVLPRDVDGLERAWRSWLEVQASNAKDRGRRAAGD